MLATRQTRQQSETIDRLRRWHGCWHEKSQCSTTLKRSRTRPSLARFISPAQQNSVAALCTAKSNKKTCNRDARAVIRPKLYGKTQDVNTIRYFFSHYTQTNRSYLTEILGSFFNGKPQVENVPLDRWANTAQGVNRLVKTPNIRDRLIVAYPDLKKEYKYDKNIRDRKRGLWIGLQAFYYQVALSYINIQKKFTDELLRSKGNY